MRTGWCIGLLGGFSRRDPARLATAYRSSHDGLPEPLCAIYEPRSHEPLGAYVAAGKTCPRRFLGGTDALLLDEPNPRALDNVNTPQEYGAVSTGMSGDTGGTPNAAAVRHLKVQYFALLREQAGRREETLESPARTPHELYAELAARYPFTLGSEMLRVAINGEFSRRTMSRVPWRGSRDPVPPARSGGAYFKLERKVGDFATAAVAAQVTFEAGDAVQKAGIALTNVGPTPIKATKAEDFLRGRKLDEANIRRAAQLAADDAQPTSDLRGPAEYKKGLVQELAKRALSRAAERAGE